MSGKIRRNIFSESDSLILDTKSGKFLTQRKQPLITLYWYNGSTLHIRYGCGVLFILSRACQSLVSDKPINSALFIYDYE